MFFKGLFYFFIVFLLENFDVIMILLIYICYFWVICVLGKGKKNFGWMYCMFLIMSVYFGIYIVILWIYDFYIVNYLLLWIFLDLYI